MFYEIGHEHVENVAQITAGSTHALDTFQSVKDCINVIGTSVAKYENISNV